MDDHEDRLPLDDLLRRAHGAAKDAEQERERSERLLEEVAAGSRRPVRCAWCGRIELGGVWRAEREVSPDHLARRDPNRASHGICPKCLADLRASGLSH
jgi:hypothetical protein